MVLDSLNSTLQQLLVHRDTLLSDQDVLKTVLKTSNENLVKLGPVPEDGAPKEPATISKKRKKLTDQNNSISSNLTSLNLLTSD